MNQSWELLTIKLNSVLRKILNNKAARHDEIPPEIWKTREFDNIFLRHSNAIYNQNTIDRWTKGCILSFPKKGNLVLAKNFWGITLMFIVVMIYNALLRNHTTQNWEEPKWLSEESIPDITNFDYPSNSWRCMCKKT